MTRIYFLTGLLALGMAGGCKAQPAPQPSDRELNRRVEVMIRSQFNAPDIKMVIGARKPSQFTGYETLPVTLSRGTDKLAAI